MPKKSKGKGGARGTPQRPKPESSVEESETTDYDSDSDSLTSNWDAYTNGVLKVIVTSQSADYDNPWQTEGVESSSGSAVCLSTAGHGEFLTAAHCVADHTFVQLQRTSDPQPVSACVVAVWHECDLALLQVEKKEDCAAFLKGIQSFALDDPNFLPSPRETVSVVGYPVGGDELSSTQGVVSRIEVQTYAHSFRKLLAITVDAAINSGNSGGPVFIKERMIGIAMQSLEDAENIGEIVPAPVIDHFLRSYREKKPFAFPTLGIHKQSLENKHLRKKLGLAAGQTGILVSSVNYKQTAYGVLQKGDVITDIDGTPVASNGTVRLLRYRTSYRVLLHKYFVGDKIKVGIIRDGKPQTLEVTLTAPSFLVPRAQYDVKNIPYFVYGGLVFMELSQNFLETWGDDWESEAPLGLVRHFKHGSQSGKRERIVLVSSCLAGHVNTGYHRHKYETVASVGETKVRDLAHFVALVDTTAAEGKDVDIRTDQETLLSFDPREVAEEEHRIFQRYRVPAQRSACLRPSSAS